MRTASCPKIDLPAPPRTRTPRRHSFQPRQHTGCVCVCVCARVVPIKRRDFVVNFFYLLVFLATTQLRPGTVYFVCTVARPDVSLWVYSTFGTGFCTGYRSSNCQQPFFASSSSSSSSSFSLRLFTASMPLMIISLLMTPFVIIERSMPEFKQNTLTSGLAARTVELR